MNHRAELASHVSDIMRMRTPSLLLAAAASGALLCAVAPGSASAQHRRRGGGASDDVHLAGTYAVRFEEVSNNCGPAGIGMNLGSAKVAVSESHGGHAIQVTIPSVPIMSGTASKGGKFRAVARRGKTAIQGVDGRFSLAGRVDGKGSMKVLFIAEYYRGKKPICTQSWNARGPRA